MRLTSHRFRKIDSADLRQGAVQNHEIELILSEESQGVVSVVRVDDIMKSELPKDVLHRRNQFHVVFRDEYFHVEMEPGTGDNCTYVDNFYRQQSHRS